MIRQRGAFTFKTIMTAMVLPCALASSLSEANAQSSGEPYIVPGAHELTMRSGAGHDYRIFLYKPDAPPPPEGYPVVYVLDGNAWFESVVSAIRMQTRQPQLSGVMPAVVVGIGYPSDAPLNQPRRFFDFVPSGFSEADMKLQYRAFKMGGAAEFAKFLLNDVAQAVEKHVKINFEQRTLFGHSLGCSFALHLLFTDPEAFPNYVCSSPSLGFGGAYLLDEESAFRGAIGDKRLDVRLLLAAGEFDEKVPPEVPSAYRNQYETAVRRAKVVTGLKALNKRLRSLSGNGLKTDLLVIERENHLSVVPVVVNRMLELMLRPSAPNRKGVAPQKQP